MVGGRDSMNDDDSGGNVVVSRSSGYGGGSFLPVKAMIDTGFTVVTMVVAMVVTGCGIGEGMNVKVAHGVGKWWFHEAVVKAYGSHGGQRCSWW
ncbi:hypothetical protein L1987_06896 [Smallanthus sonchifolius]|uniref:Uncharacterized protein n=1 Tax=Smallanthus sonchifolius TaxID=185202 RepID=A0ACB9JZL7_9ASTR|nr:hypothetical protein L1987_06896 [Smallanthus sonchifolius]